MATAHTLTATAGETLQRGVIEQLGRKIVTGQWPAGSVLRMDTLATQLGISRSVVREAVGVLSTLGLVRSRKHRGTTVLASSKWNAFAPDIIAWRLDDPAQRDEQFRSLVELRSAVEPLAAQLAAHRIDPQAAAEMVEIATAMVDTGIAGQIAAFVEADLIFHRLLLQASGNALFASLDQILAEILAGKHRLGLMPITTDPVATRRHLELAQAIAAHDATTAMTACSYIVQQSAQELHARDADTSD